MDCLSTIFRYRVSARLVVKSGQIFEIVKRAVVFNHQNRGVDRKPNIANTRVLKIKYNKLLLSSFKRIKATKTRESVSGNTTEDVKQTNYELEMIILVDCFLDDHGIYTVYLVSFKEKSL